MALSSIEYEDAPEQAILRVQVQAPRDALAQRITETHTRLMEQVLARGAHPGPCFVQRTSRGADPTTMWVGVCVPTPLEADGDILAAKIPGGRVACAVWTGAFAGLEEAAGTIAADAKRRGLRPVAPAYEFTLTGPTDVTSVAQMRTRIYLPVRPG